MATRYECDGCGRDSNPAELRRVEVRVATLPGVGARPGLATDEARVGDLCVECVTVALDFVDSTASAFARDDARRRLRAV